MILDQNALFSDKQAITASAASTNFYDLGAPGVTGYNSAQLLRNLGKGKETPLLVQVNEDFDALTSLSIAIQSDEDPAFGTPKTVVEISVPLADLVVGYILPIDKLPRDIKERYVRIFYTVVGLAPTTGQITAGIVAAVDGSYVG